MRASSAAVLAGLCAGLLWACGGDGGTSPSDVVSDEPGDAESGWEGDIGPDVGDVDEVDDDTPTDGLDGESDDASCTPTGDETCDGLDNDCDGETDEDFDLTTDPDNCGGCGVVCRPDHATGGCADSACDFTCDDGWVDLNESTVDGCEYECTSLGAEGADGTCDDLQDNDCDGRTDMDDTDCAPCVPEFCNLLDDDCDGLTDEDFDTDFDPDNCGACGTVCPSRDHAVATCVLGSCDINCESGWSDLDRDPANGCEASCEPLPTPQEWNCDGIDDDCDGLTDEEFAGTECGEGLCRRASICWRGEETACTPRTPPATTDVTCDGLDDDCDGATDEDGSCECYTDPDCDDGVDCTVDVCVTGEGRCEHTPDSMACSDGDVCSGDEVCDVVMGCIAGTPIDCSDGITCTDDLCNPLSGACSWSANHTRCSGSNICDPPRSTNSTGCAPPPACAGDSDCNDGNACNGVETCGADLLCRPGTPVDCSDALTCTTDVCAPADGSCSHLSPDADADTYPDAACTGTDCNDRNVAIYPGAPEICDGVDQNCDGDPDAGAVCAVLPHTSSASCVGGLCVPNCLSGWGDCDGILINGCDTALNTLTNCGACGVPCDLPRASESCSTGSCQITSCDTPWGDCNATAGDGCESSLTTLTNCGACGLACAPDHATGATCITGACSFSGCSIGWGNCDGNASNGCERSLTSATDCGSCGVPCDLANASESCATGSCVLLSCNPNWGNCDASQINGCETSLLTLANCGTCGTPCDLANASESCASGTCTLSSCASNYGNCDGNPLNGCETSLVTLTDCATCGTPCNPANATGPSCAAGVCTYASCSSGYGSCDGLSSNGCETSLRTLADCGGCGVACDLANATESCSTGTCQIGSCSSGYGNCDGITSNGCEASLTTMSNCGACGTACAPAHATGGSCSTGTCVYGSCSSGWGDCDGNASNGCEISLRTLTDCGTCDTPCDLANASESCATGTCTLSACNSGYGNCDGITANGCEASLTSLTNCGACGAACSLANASESCATGTCTLTSCDAGYGNCDGNTANGCEASLTSLTNCGACGAACDLANASESCATGTCTLTSCSSGWGNCDGNTANGCEASLTTLTNCGACGTGCSLANASETCASGSCLIATCDAGYGNCDGNTANGCEAALNTLANCGSCGTACNLANASESCATGTCTLTGCTSGYGNCDGITGNGCELALNTLTNCGACGTACSPAHATGASCSSGSCTYGACTAGWGNCDGNTPNGCETSLYTLTDCGSCGTGCDLANASESCATGTCTLSSCNSGFGNCDGLTPNGCEAPLTTLTNCGSCGTACAPANASGPSCSTGSCTFSTCNAGFGNCDGIGSNGCENTLDSLANCGSCGTACGPFSNATPTCAGDVCAISSCNSGWGNCDGVTANGCENTLDSLTNCGSCGTACALANAGESCAGDVCNITSCNAGFGNCDGVTANGCENTLDSLTNCGTCGTACALANASESCAGDVCNITTCNAGWGNCDGLTGNGCENSLDSLTNCSSCGTACGPFANATATCAGDVCGIASCNAGWGNCDGITANGCENSLDSLASCGSCGTTCGPFANATATCAGDVCGIATCNAGWGNCDGLLANGCENSLDSLTNCGTCGTACNLANAGESCAGDVCNITTCSAGWGNCDGITANGCENSLDSLTNCGSCGIACALANASESCAGDVCNITSCNAGWGNCDGLTGNGCENSLDSLTNCGACGTACSRTNATATCAGDVCNIASCNPGWGNCDGNQLNGCENSLDSLTNCGSCGTACSRANATATCAGDVCAILACNAGWANPDLNDANGCECALEAGETFTHEACATATVLTTIGDGSTRYTVTGKLANTGDIDCYRFAATDTTPAGPGDIHHVDIRFTSNPGSEFQITVYRTTSCTTACTALYVIGDNYTWFTDQPAGTCTNPTGPAPCGEGNCTTASTYGYNICNDDSNTYTFCVSRRAGSASCSSYVVEYSNGYY